jgi:hypothetical protein
MNDAKVMLASTKHCSAILVYVGPFFFLLDLAFLKFTLCQPFDPSGKGARNPVRHSHEAGAAAVPSRYLRRHHHPER